MSALFPLVLEGAEHRAKGKTLFGPVDLRLEPGGGTCVVIGPNGAGKTTLLRLLHGTARLSAGEIRWACGAQSARAAQSFVFQRPIMLRRTVLENIAYPLRLRGMPRAKARESAAKWAAHAGLERLLERPAPQLSGGEQQKLALVRALVTRPALLFLDEPCAALDGASMREVEQILQRAQSQGTRLILATHDMGQARRMADEVLFVLRARVHEFTPAARFFTAPQTSEARAFLAGEIVE